MTTPSTAVPKMASRIRPKDRERSCSRFEQESCPGSGCSTSPSGDPTKSTR